MANKLIIIMQGLMENIRRNINLAALGLSLFVIYLFTQRWLELYLQSRPLQIIMVFVSLLLIFMAVFNRNFIKSKLIALDCIWLPAILFILAYILFYGNPAYRYDIFIYSVGYGLLVLTKVKLIDYQLSFSIMKFAALTFALGTVIQYFYTEIFNEFLFNYTVTSSQEMISRLTRRNYYPGFAFGQPAVAAVYLSVGIGAVISLLEKNHVRTIINSILLFLLLLALFMVGKRALLVATFAAIPFMYIFSALGKDIWKRILVSSTLMLVLAGLALLVVPYIDDFAFLQRIQQLIGVITGGELTGSLLVRYTIYTDAWALFMENPVLGVGWNNFELITSGFYSSDYEVHNVYLQLLTEMGIVGFILVFTPLAYSYYITFKAYRKTLTDQTVYNVIWSKGLLFSLYYQSVFLIYAFGESPFYHLIHVSFYFFALTIVGSYLALNKNNGVKEK